MSVVQWHVDAPTDSSLSLSQPPEIIQNPVSMMNSPVPSSSDIVLSFQDIQCATQPVRPRSSALNSPAVPLLLDSVHGYVRAGGMTALVGCASSGKSLLLKTLAGRTAEDSLFVTGRISIKPKTSASCSEAGVSFPAPAPIFPDVIEASNSTSVISDGRVGFVGPDDILIGELTVRETLAYSINLHRDPNSSDADREKESTLIDSVIQRLGLGPVADHVVGTVLKRGLSGGEKRRLSVAVELVAQPACLILDEATSGLDATSAYALISVIKAMASANGSMGVIAVVQQPNRRLLELFDDLLILGAGKTMYMGPMTRFEPYLQSLGLLCPNHLAPTEYFLHATSEFADDVNDSDRQNFKQTNTASPVESETITVTAASATVAFDMGPQTRASTPVNRISGREAVDLYTQSPVFSEVVRNIAPPSTVSPLVGRGVPISVHLRKWWWQFLVLCRRFVLMGIRDVTLYWLQLVLNSGYGFLVGALFFQLPRTIGPRDQDIGNGIVWLVFIATYIQVFKVYYLMELKRRFHHERSNGAFSPSAWAVADFVVTSWWTFVIFMPGLVAAFFMMNLPAESVGYTIAMLFLSALTAESLVDLLGQFSRTTPVAILIGQGALVTTCVFAGGAFIGFDVINHNFWVWLSEISIYTWSTRGILIHVHSHLSYSCPSDFQSTIDNTCQYNGLVYPCSSPNPSNGICDISGSDYLRITKGIDSTDSALQIGIVAALLVVFRLLTYIFQRWSPAQLYVLLVRLIHQHDPPTTGVSEPQATRAIQVAANPGNPASSVPHHQINISSLPDPGAHQPSTARSDLFRHDDSCLSWSHLSLRLRSTDAVLVDDVSGKAISGRILSIMGPSGAGKTTFLNALSGRAPYARVVGSVLLNGQPMRQNQIVYVPQFDALNPSISVFDSMCFMSRMQNRTDGELYEVCRQRVLRLLQLLDLSDVRDWKIGRLSSGERKRLSIGIALIGDPQILFLDEPTTGLDSEAAFVLITYLRRVCKVTRVVCLLTLHQPSPLLFDMLDDLLLLARPGQTAYFGPCKQASAYLEQIGFRHGRDENVADVMLDLMAMKPHQALMGQAERSHQPVELERVVMTTTTACSLLPTASQGLELALPQAGAGDSLSITAETTWKQLFAQFLALPGNSVAEPLTRSNAGDRTHIRQSSKDDESRISHSRPSEFSRFLLLLRFRLYYFWLEPALYRFRLLELTVFALFIGSLFYQLPLELARLSDITGALFFNVWCVLFATIAATPIFVRDRLIFENDYLNGAFSLVTFELSSWLASLPYNLFTAIVYQAILWWMVGFHSTAESFLFAILSTLVLLMLMESISLIVVQALKEAMLSTTVSMVILGCFFLFPGFFIQVPNMPRSVFWLSYIVPTKYSLQSQLKNIFADQLYSATTSSGTFASVSGSNILTDFFNQSSDYNKWSDWGIVLAYAVGLRLIYVAVVRWHYSSYRVPTATE